MKNKSVFFVSDLHLGAPNRERSLERELKFIQWIDAHEDQMEALFIVGDLFDFWFEYKRAVPRGFVRTLGRLALLRDTGVPIHFFTGNHDMWVFDYLEDEIGMKIHRSPQLFHLQGKDLLVGHGDGLGPGDKGYKFIKKVFANPFMQWFYARIHPNTGIWLADYFSRKSRAKTGEDDSIFTGNENEWLYQYACEYQEKEKPVDYFIFGHRHLPLNITLPKQGVYYNLGDWIRYYTYGVLENGAFKLKYWKDDGSEQGFVSK